MPEYDFYYPEEEFQSGYDVGGGFNPADISVPDVLRDFGSADFGQLDMAGQNLSDPDIYSQLDMSQYSNDPYDSREVPTDMISRAQWDEPLPAAPGYWDEEKGVFIYEHTDPETGEKVRGVSSSPNPSDMGFTDAKTGKWVSASEAASRIPSGGPSSGSRLARTGADIMRSAGASPQSGIQRVLNSLFGQSGGKNDMMSLLPFLLMMLAMQKKDQSAPSGTIPQMTASRTQLPYGGGQANYRPGQGGVNYFTPTTYRAAGGITSLNEGNLGGYSDGGRLLKGPGDGVSDDIPATIGGKQPARLADGEFVIPARIVSELGNGSTDAGARKLYAMMKRVEKTRKKGKHIAQDTKADKHLPA